jgi:hypothetical protein
MNAYNAHVRLCLGMTRLGLQVLQSGANHPLFFVGEHGFNHRTWGEPFHCLQPVGRQTEI